MSRFSGDRTVAKNDYVDIDAAFDAHQARLEAEWRGEVIAKPTHWEARAARFRRMDGRRLRLQQGEALAKFMHGENTDLYGRLPVLRGDDYKAHLRKQARERAARARAKGIVRAGRDG